MATSLVVLLAATLWLTTASHMPSTAGSMIDMMNRMMQGGVMGGAAPIGLFMQPIFVALVGLIVVGSVGLIFSALFPEIKSTQPEYKPGLPSPYREDSWEVVVKTLKPEELRLLEVLKSRNGRYLQKYLSKEAGLNRLQTHRIVARFAERGLVSVRKVGNTNEVAIADWLFPRERKELHGGA